MQKMCKHDHMYVCNTYINDYSTHLLNFTRGYVSNILAIILNYFMTTVISSHTIHMYLQVCILHTYVVCVDMYVCTITVILILSMVQLTHSCAHAGFGKFVRNPRFINEFTSFA